MVVVGGGSSSSIHRQRRHFSGSIVASASGSWESSSSFSPPAVYPASRIPAAVAVRPLHLDALQSLRDLRPSRSSSGASTAPPSVTDRELVNAAVHATQHQHHPTPQHSGHHLAAGGREGGVNHPPLTNWANGSGGGDCSSERASASSPAPFASASSAAPSSPTHSAVSSSSTSSPLLRWRCGSLLGKGAFGSVFMGFDEDSGEIIAVKHLVAAKAGAPGGLRARELRDMENEVALLQSLQHANIVRYLGTQRLPDQLCIFLEYMSGGEEAPISGGV